MRGEIGDKRGVVGGVREEDERGGGWRRLIEEGMERVE